MGLITDHCPYCDAELRLELAAWRDALELRCPECATSVELEPDPVPRVQGTLLAA